MLIHNFCVCVCVFIHRRADKVLEVVSDDRTPRRKHKFAYGEHIDIVTCTCPCVVTCVSMCSGIVFLSHTLTHTLSYMLTHTPLTVSGLGFGTIAAVVLFANVLRESGGPGIVGVDDGGSQYFVLIAGKNIVCICF